MEGCYQRGLPRLVSQETRIFLVFYFFLFSYLEQKNAKKIFQYTLDFEQIGLAIDCFNDLMMQTGIAGSDSSCWDTFFCQRTLFFLPIFLL